MTESDNAAKYEAKKAEIKSEADAEGFVSFQRVSRGLLEQSAQYTSDFVGGLSGKPDLCEGLRFKGDVDEYYDLKIHQADIDEFVDRVKKWRKETGRDILYR